MNDPALLMRCAVIDGVLKCAVRDGVLKCEGCGRRFAELGAYEWQGRMYLQCEDCRRFMEKVRGVAIHAVPWGLAEARRQGIAKN